MFNPVDESIPKVVIALIDKMLDEDCTNATGTAEKAATSLLDRAIKCGRENEFKEALKFWKSTRKAPDDVLWQWFLGVFRGVKSGAKDRSKYKPRGRKRS